MIHSPSLKNIKNKKIREKLEDYFVSYSSINNQLHKLDSNFNKNIKLYDKFIDNIKAQLFEKDLYIVTAGPSLNSDFLELKKVVDNGISFQLGLY